ncbi:MAG: L,D-transpeptidase [bacterium]|nr:L,D-transpeptidase [bacterium]
MKPKHSQLTLIGIFVFFAYILSLAEPEEENADTTKIIIIRSTNTLCLYINDSIAKTYRIAVGKTDTPTPLGNFRIVNKVVNPSWYPLGKDPIPPKVASNPVGTRWLGLSVKGYGIHGTNQPSSIGKMVSKGCIRMRNKDVEELFPLVSIGTSVEIIDKPEPIDTSGREPQYVADSEIRPILLATAVLIQ